jgi:hypothetical protein
MAADRRWRLVRVPEALAQRLESLAADTGLAYAEGRLDLPTEFCERIPLWLVIERALDQVEAKRIRSARPRKRQPS